ncbi:MAG: hypothetical protein ACXADY_23090 [Candidatus Hodarchaeales archaeon]|jgi:hypothetical protein
MTNNGKNQLSCTSNGRIRTIKTMVKRMCDGTCDGMNEGDDKVCAMCAHSSRRTYDTAGDLRVDTLVCLSPDRYQHEVIHDYVEGFVYAYVPLCEDINKDGKCAHYAYVGTATGAHIQAIRGSHATGYRNARRGRIPTT